MEHQCLICNNKLNRGAKKYCSRECYYKAKEGEGNHFYGKTHSEETRKKLREANLGLHKGEKNHFYGKTHSEKSKELIREKNRIYRENNKALLLQKRLDRKGLTKSQIEEVWNEYVSGPYNRSHLTEKLGIDYRTAQKFLIDLGIETREGIKLVGLHKRLFLHGRSISAPEIKLLAMLEEAFGAENVKHQHYQFGYFYDFLVNGEILVEYDGYYYHKVLKNNNDAIKEELALTNGFSFVRIEEDKNRYVDFEKGIERIRDEFQAM